MTDFPTLEPYGWNDRWRALLAGAEPGSRPGRVLRHDGVAVLTITPDGEASIPLNRSLDPAPVVGDWLALADQDSRIAAVLDRTSLLRRRAAGRDAEQPLVANADVVLVVNGLDRPVSTGRIQRFAALAWDAGATPVIVLTKDDLVADADRIVADLVDEHPGLDILATSSRTDHGVDAVRQRIGNGTVVLLGESGAGKSTLVNALVGDGVAATGAVRRGDSKGRHTTTTRELHLLPGGGVLVDTPGVREVGLWIDPDAVDETFPEVEELAEECRFADCNHTGDPGCAIAIALAEGRLSQDRVDAWLAMRREAEAAATRSDPRLARQRAKQFGKLTKEATRRSRR